MTLQERLKSDMISSMKAKNVERINFIKFLLGQVNLKGKIVSDEEVIKILRSTVKTSTQMGNEFELKILAEYLPKMLDESATRPIVERIIDENEFSSMKDMGKIMSILRQNPLIDGKVSSKIIKELLQ